MTGPLVLTLDGLDMLIAHLRDAGRTVIGPVLRDDAIVYDEIESSRDLPKGVTDEQQPGRYRVRRRDDDALFGYAVGPHSWKKYLHAPRQTLWRATRDSEGIRIESPRETPPSLVFLGVRACELNAIRIQDRVLVEGDYVDTHYQARRAAALVIAVNCGEAGGVCFCASMGAGPRVSAGYDLALTELSTDGEPWFLLEVGTPAGASMIERLPHRAATAAEIEAAEVRVAASARQMGREMPAVDLRAMLAENLQHARWRDVAARCLSCANCTMVCPTCFCTTVDETSDLAGTEFSRERRWDSCFTMDFSYLHGGSVRTSVESRYRQWMTHKLSTWFDQFGESGCVGCGRCIAWCPVGIDITEEARALAGDEAGRSAAR